MLIKKPSDIEPAEITPRDIYMNRRQFIWAAAMIRRLGNVGSNCTAWFTSRRSPP